MGVCDKEEGVKSQIQNVPVALLVAVESALAEGRAKYGERSWRTNNEKSSKLVGAIMRHALSWWSGEEVDPESSTGKSHLSGVAASVAILLDCIHCGTLDDDRPPPGPDANLLRDYNREAEGGGK